jgi:hypothetical protein
MGRLYVALSRCRTIDGMVLSKPAGIERRSKPMRRCAGSASASKQNHHISAVECREKTNTSSICYSIALILSAFATCLRRMTGLVLGNPSGYMLPVWKIFASCRKRPKMKSVPSVHNFQRQLQGLFATGSLPADDAVLERIIQGIGLFQGKN